MRKNWWFVTLFILLLFPHCTEATEGRILINQEAIKTHEHAVMRPTSQDKLFILAIRSNDFSVVEQCLNQGADINGVFNLGGAGITPLVAARSREMQQYLLEKGADVRGYQTLTYSQSNKKPDLYEKLWMLKNGGYESYFVSYLSCAAYDGDYELARYYRAWGAPINADGWSNDNFEHPKYYGPPIISALKGCSRQKLNDTDFINFIQYLADEGADLERNIDGLTPFLFAVQHRSYELIDCLAANGARLDAKDYEGRDASQIAIDNNDLQLYKYIQEVNKRGQQPSKCK